MLCVNNVIRQSQIWPQKAETLSELRIFMILVEFSWFLHFWGRKRSENAQKTQTCGKNLQTIVKKTSSKSSKSRQMSPKSSESRRKSRQQVVNMSSKSPHKVVKQVVKKSSTTRQKVIP